MIEAFLFLLAIALPALSYRWLRRQRHPWRAFLFSVAAIAGFFGYASSLISFGHAGSFGWLPGLVLASFYGFVILVIWASNGGQWS
jgi:hypothetical protein